VLKKVLIIGRSRCGCWATPDGQCTSAAPFDAEAAVTNAQTAADTAFSDVISNGTANDAGLPFLWGFVWAQHPQYAADELLAHGNRE